jgi:hypothetical protein
MYVSEPHFGLKLGKSSKRAKSCFLQRLKKNKKTVMRSVNIHGPCCKYGGKEIYECSRAPVPMKKITTLNHCGADAQIFGPKFQKIYPVMRKYIV